MSARNNSFSLNFQSKKMKEKLREIELTRASISLLQLNLSKNIACSPAHTHNIFSEKFHEMRQKATEFKEHMGGKNITVLVGRSGAGKTHIGNKILNMSKPSDEEYQILNEYGNGKHESLEVYSIPDPENFFSEFTTNIFLRYSKLEMKHAILRKYFMASSEIASQLDGSFFLLPETELSTAAKVPSRIVYGSELRVTLVFDQAQTIQSLLDLLKDSIKNSRMEVENGTYFPTSFCSDRKTHSPDKSSMTGVLLRKALSILGLNANTNIKEIDFENVCVPKDLINFLGTCISFIPRNYSTFEEQVKQIKSFIFHNTCCDNKFSHIIRYIVIQYPSNLFINGLELIDTPSFTSKSTFESKKMHNDATGSASTVIHVCDERKIDDGFRTLLLQYLMAENFHHEKKRFFIVNNLREPKSSKFEENLILLRLRELTSLDYLTANNAKLYDEFCKNCSVLVYSKSQNIHESSLRELIDILCTDSSYPFHDNAQDYHRVRTLLIKTMTDCRFLLRELFHFSCCHEHFLGKLVYDMILFSRVIKSKMYHCAFDELFLSERVSYAYEKLPALNSNTFLCLDACIEFGLVFGAKPTKIAQIFFEISRSKERIVKYYFLAICMGGLKEYTQNSIQKTFESFLKIFLDEVLPFVPQEVLSVHETNDTALRKRLLQNYVNCLRRKIMKEISFLFFEIWQEQFECSLHESLKQLKNDDGAHRCEPLQLLYMNDHLNEKVRSATLKYCCNNLQHNFPKIIEKCILLCSEFTKTTIQNLDQELSQFVLDTLIINLEYLPMVELFLKTTPVHFGDLEKIAGRTYSEICHKSWTRNEYETFFIELPKLIDSNFEESVIEQIFNCIWSVRSIEVDDKNSMMSLKNRIIRSCNLFGADARVFSWISSVLNFCKIPRCSSPVKNSNTSKSSDFSLAFSSRRRAILNGLSFIASKINDDVFFNEWGSDILVTLYFFMEISCDDDIVGICESNLNIGVEKWQILSSCLQFGAGPEDSKYLLEGIFVLYKLSRNHAKLRKQIYAKINRLHSSTLLSINKQNNKTNTLHKTKDKELNDDMVWSFFFRENGVHIENGSEVDLDIRCHTKNASLSFSKSENNIFREHSYFVTHKIFTKSEWCQYSLIPEEWLIEISFMKFNLPNFIRVRDVEITGEFVQALKGVGISELDEDIQQATKFLISTQHFDGSWLQSEISDRKYHATVCAVGALLDHNYKYRRHSNNIIS